MCTLYLQVNQTGSEKLLADAYEEYAIAYSSDQLQ